MRNLWFIFDARKRCPELFAQGTLVARKGGRAPGRANEVAQVDHELPAKATTREGRGLGKERRKEHHRKRIRLGVVGVLIKSAAKSTNR
jgi:hypothetical protein